MIQVKKGKTQGNYLLVRTRIIVNIGERDPLRQAEPRRKCCTAEYHPHYSPLDTAVAGKLNGERLRQIVNEVELKHLADIISCNPSKQNKEMQDEIKKMF